MAIGTYADLVMNTEFFQLGVMEKLTQYTDLFNEQAGGAIQVIPQALSGHYNNEDFFTNISNLITRRDITSIAAATILHPAQATQVGVKVDRKYVVGITKDALRKINMTSETYSLGLGRQVAKDLAVDYLNTGLISAVAALKGNTASLTDTTQLGAVMDYSSSSIDPAYLADALALFGDNSNNIVCWVMHSAVYWDLVKNNMAANLSGLSNVVIYGGLPGSLGKPVFVTDSSSLITAGPPDVYHVLGLTPGAIRLLESETETPFNGILPGLENMTYLIQGENAYNIMIKGYAYQTASGISPTNATLGTTAAWSQVATDDKSTAGVVLHVIKSTGGGKTV
jgi:hypothetical protein